MVHKDFRYYINTIFLKTNALMYDWADRCGLLESSKKKTQKKFFDLYIKHFSKDEIGINVSFSKEYTSYRFFSKASELEAHLGLNTEGGKVLNVEKIQHNPLLSAYFALVCYNDFLTYKNEDSLEKFCAQTAYLEKRGTEQQGGLAFIYEEDLADSDIKAPWYSGITQGLIASVFIRAFDLTKNVVYKEKARQIIEAMFVPIEKKGVFCQTSDGFDWIEEYPSVSRRSLVLLGFIFSIVALYEYLILCEADKTLEKRLERLVESFFKSLHYYIRGKFVKYCQFSKEFQNINYQGLMVFQLLHLFELSGNKAFFDIAFSFHKNMNWDAYFRFYQIDPPQYFNTYFKS